jgi:hypothetical protein
LSMHRLIFYLIDRDVRDTFPSLEGYRGGLILFRDAFHKIHASD